MDDASTNERPEEEFPKTEVSDVTFDVLAGVPERVGPYRIVRIIGSGGMGTVYEALQEEPQRRVALKVMKRGLASEMALRRFELETQSLGRMSHPAIAQVFEADTQGRGTGGLPYFAMEYIPDAKAITEFADSQELDLPQRLSLFRQVCEAIQHGHQKGIIHRDLKPGNILVDSGGRPKVIDFGVARATDADLAATTLLTEIGQIVGTLQYMSPEQCEADPHNLDTRSDVYSLGVILYELISGDIPYDLSRTSLVEATRAIREHVPRRLTSINPALDQDLETIALKALEKDRERRYSSARELADDVGRYLNCEPIQARPPSVTYQLRMFARRHRAVVTGAALAVSALLAGTAVATWQAVRASRAEAEAVSLARSERQQYERALEALREADEARAAEMTQREEAQTQAETAKTINAFLEGMLSAPNPWGQQYGSSARDVRVRDVLDAASATIAGQFRQPTVEAAIRATLGSTYLSLGEHAAAAMHLERADELFTAEAGEEDTRTLDVRNRLGELAILTGRFSAAETLLEACLRARRRILGEEHADTMTSMNNLAQLYAYQARFDEAEELYRSTLELRRRVFGPEHPSTLGTMSDLATLYFDKGSYPQTEPLYTDILETRERVLGEEHPETLLSLNNMAILLRKLGRFAESEAMHSKALELRQRVLGEEHPRTLDSIDGLASVCEEQGRYDEAEGWHRRALDVRRNLLGEKHPDTLTSMNNLAHLYLAQGRYGDAEPICLRNLELRRETLGDEHPQTLTSMNRVGYLYRKQGRDDEAAPYYVKTLEIRRRVLGADHPSTLISMSNLASLRRSQGKHDLAADLLENVLKRRQRLLGEDHPSTINSQNNLAALYSDMGRDAEAELLYQSALEGRRRTLGVDHPRTLHTQHNLAYFYSKLGRSKEAERLLHATVEGERRALPEHHPRRADTLASHGRCLIDLGRYEEGESVLLEAHSVVGSAQGARLELRLKILRALSDLYAAWNRPLEAEEWQAKVRQLEAAAKASVE